MNRNKLAAKLHHFRTADSRLEPLAMMVGGIPPIDGCVIAAEGYFERIALIETDDGTLHFGLKPGAPPNPASRRALSVISLKKFTFGASADTKCSVNCPSLNPLCVPFWSDPEKSISEKPRSSSEGY